MEDFLACANYLIAQHVTGPKHLVGQGGSAGGIPIGVAAVTHPKLFSAMLDEVPASDILRSSGVQSNVCEFGSPDDPAQFAEMLAMSPYYHVTPGTKYPAMLLTAGINDPRIHAWEVAQMAARLQASSASGRPILLRVDYDSGHGSSTGTLADALLADEYAFAFQQGE